MAQQVTPNVGGTTASVPVTSVTPPPAAVIPAPSVPQYRMDFAGITRAAAAGLSNPTAVGDFEIAFSRIAADLKDALNVLADLNKVGLSQSRRAELSVAFAAFAQMADWGQSLDANRANITRQTDIINAETLRKTEAEGLKGPLERERDAKDAQLTQNGKDIKTYEGNIQALRDEDAGLVARLGRLDPQKDATEIGNINRRRAAIPGDIAYWEQQITNKLQENQRLPGEIDALKTRIKGLEDIISDAGARIGDASKSRTASQQIVNTVPSLMTSFIDSTVILMQFLAGKVASDMAADTFATPSEGGQFDRLISALAASLVNLGSILTNAQIGRDVASGDGAGTGLNLDQSAPGRFGQPNSTVARALAFAGIVAGVLGAVADLLNAIKNGLGMQTAESFANAGAARVRVGV